MHITIFLHSRSSLPDTAASRRDRLRSRWRRAAPESPTTSRPKRCPTGCKVIVLENHKAPVATFNVFYHVGSRNEQSGKTGLSHLLEHLMFRGTKKLKPEEFSKIIQANGGDENAIPATDYTDYFENHQPRSSRRADLRSKPTGWRISIPRVSIRKTRW